MSDRDWIDLKRAGSNPKKYVLVVDDDPDVLDSLSRTLEGLGVAVVRAANPFEARTRLAMQAFDLIITDVNMPRENGIKFLISLHKSSESRAQAMPPIIIISAVQIPDHVKVQLTKILGVQAIMEKPWDSEALANFVKKRIVSEQSESEVRTEILSAVLRAFSMAVSNKLGIKLTQGKAFATIQVQSIGEFAGFLHLKSKLMNVAAAISFTKGAVEKFARIVLGEEEVECTDQILLDVVDDLLEEAVNILEEQLHKNGKIFEMSPRTVVSGMKLRVQTAKNASAGQEEAMHRIVVPFEWEGERIYAQFVTSQPGAPKKSATVR